MKLLNHLEVVVMELHMSGIESFVKYLVIHSLLDNKTVAIKFSKTNDSLKNAQKREKNISTIVDHRNIIQTYCYFYEFFPNHGGQHLALVMEKADCDLKNYLSKQRDLSYEDRKHLIVEIATGLDYLYDQHITLHDLKVF